MIPKPFSLDIVLKIRKRKEDLAQQKLMQALSKQKDIEENIKTAQIELLDLTRLLGKKQQQ